MKSSRGSFVNDEIWVVDTSSLINWQDWLRASVLPEVWRGLADRAHSGELFVPDKVKQELSKDTRFSAWIDYLPNSCFWTPGTADLKTVAEIQHAFPALAPTPAKPGVADAYVVAAGRVLGGVVVTDELTTRGSTTGSAPFAKSQKMDAAARNYGLTVRDGKETIYRVVRQLRELGVF